MQFDQYFNKREALSRIRGNEKLLLMMAKMFLSSKEVAELENCLQARDTEAAAIQAHAVKGVAGNLSFPLLYKAVAEINQQLKQGEYNEVSIAKYRTILAETQAAVKAVCGL